MTGLRPLIACVSLCALACVKDAASAARSIHDPLPPLPSGASASAGPGGAPGTAIPEWVATFDDELDTSAFDENKWFLFDGDPHHKDTINSASRALAVQHDGSAFLNAEAAPAPQNMAFPYAAGYVDTHARFAQTYGKIEFRARVAYAPGVWFALWGRAWADLVPEIDLEFLARDVTQVWMVNHWGVAPLPADQRRGVTTVDGTDITLFHTYTIVWKPDLLEWQIDGQPYRRVTDEHVPHEAMFWVMNAWVGGWGGTPGPGTQFPASMEVDYVRIWRLGEWAAPPSIRIAGAKASYATAETIDVELADFDAAARVEIWEGTTRLGTLEAPPFRFQPSHLSQGAHGLTFTGTDGARTASIALEVTIHD